MIILLNYFLSDELKNRGVLTETTEYAWKYKDAIDVIDFLKVKECVILGGDVLKSTLEYTHDNWFFEYDNKGAISEIIKESIEKSKRYINWYHEKFGDDFYYIIVAIKKADYLLKYV